MKRCCARRTAWLQNQNTSAIARRWRSYDRGTLTEKALLSRIEEGFSNASSEPRVNSTTKTIRTAAGELPISPLFDPKWIASRRRETKGYNPKPSGRFRSKVSNNPYARALETPLRSCPVSRTSLPRFFLQDFEAVQHPQTGKPWWAPGPLSFYHLENDIDVAARKKAQSLEAEKDDELQEGAFSGQPEVPRNDTEASAIESRTKATGLGDQDGESNRETREDVHAAEEGHPEQTKRHRGMGARASVVGYAVSKKSLLSQIKPGKVPLLAMRRGMSVDNTIRAAVWRPDMADVLEGMLREQVVNTLVRRANRTEGQNPHKFVEPCADWEQAKRVRLRSCVLWLPKEEVRQAGGYPTLDVNTTYGSKVAVYNLPWLLGEEEVKRLKEQAPMFREAEILVLKAWPTWSVKSLHMLLWRLQGFLAAPQGKR